MPERERVPATNERSKLGGLVKRTTEVMLSAPNPCFSDIPKSRALESLRLVRDLLSAPLLYSDPAAPGARWLGLYDLFSGDEQNELAERCHEIRNRVAAAEPIGGAIAAMESTVETQLEVLATELERLPEGRILSGLSEQHYELTDRLRVLHTLDAASRSAAALPISAPESEQRGSQDQDTPGKGIFIVHGHDDRLLQEVARFVQTVTDQTPIVLHEQPNSGRTLIEKFEQRAESAGFAVILLTADDEGGELDSEIRTPRSRQNVVFEFGFFIGLVRRERTAVLYETDVELPSDLQGLAYIEIDSPGAWKMKLAQELRAAGIEADLNRAID